MPKRKLISVTGQDIDLPTGFQLLDHMEKLIALRESDHNAFLLRTSEATRRALGWYEAGKVKTESNTETTLKKV